MMQKTSLIALVLLLPVVPAVAQNTTVTQQDCVTNSCTKVNTERLKIEQAMVDRMTKKIQAVLPKLESARLIVKYADYDDDPIVSQWTDYCQGKLAVLREGKAVLFPPPTIKESGVGTEDFISTALSPPRDCKDKRVYRSQNNQKKSTTKRQNSRWLYSKDSYFVIEVFRDGIDGPLFDSSDNQCRLVAAWPTYSYWTENQQRKTGSRAILNLSAGLAEINGELFGIETGTLRDGDGNKLGEDEYTVLINELERMKVEEGEIFALIPLSLPQKAMYEAIHLPWPPESARFQKTTFLQKHKYCTWMLDNPRIKQ